MASSTSSTVFQGRPSRVGPDQLGLVVAVHGLGHSVIVGIVDAFSYNYQVAVPSDAVYDRSPLVHEVNLFDLGQKYVDVSTTSNLIEALNTIAEH